MRLFPLMLKALFTNSTFESRLQLAGLRQLAGFCRNSFSSAVLCAGPTCTPHCGGQPTSHSSWSLGFSETAVALTWHSKPLPRWSHLLFQLCGEHPSLNSLAFDPSAFLRLACPSSLSPPILPSKCRFNSDLAPWKFL